MYQEIRVKPLLTWVMGGGVGGSYGVLPRSNEGPFEIESKYMVRNEIEMRQVTLEKEFQPVRCSKVLLCNDHR